MSDSLYRGHDAKYWHGRYVQATGAYLDCLLDLLKKDPELKEDVLAELRFNGRLDALKDLLAGRPRPQGVEYLEDD